MGIEKGGTWIVVINDFLKTVNGYDYSILLVYLLSGHCYIALSVSECETDSYAP